MTPALTNFMRDEIRSLSTRAEPWGAVHNLSREYAVLRKMAAARRDGQTV